MKASDYIVEFLIAYGIKDVFGYPGGTVTHLMHSLNKYKDSISTHLLYHEQAVAFAACSYAESYDYHFGVAFATSGPGATNLMTGICNAYFDSLPVLFITGQVNSEDVLPDVQVRQVGFQQTDIVSMVDSFTKYSHYVTSSEDLRNALDEAIHQMWFGRPGPVLLDIPMNVFRMDIQHIDGEKRGTNSIKISRSYNLDKVHRVISDAKRPVVILGHGVHLSGAQEIVKKFLRKSQLPVVSSMLAVDILSRDNHQYYGFIGAYGDRAANFIVAKSDLLICLGTRLDIRQTGRDRTKFAPEAKIIRVDIDDNELNYEVHKDDIKILSDLNEVIKELCKKEYDSKEKWLQVCNVIRTELKPYEPDFIYNHIISEISFHIPDGLHITTDVGQNQVWVAQSFMCKPSQRILFSGGHGAMGYSLPAAIGCAYASLKPVISISGDGGFQMNIQELQTIVRDNLPIVMVVINNKSLGMIRHFQEMYFDSEFSMTVEDGGYSSPDFKKIADAYGIQYYKICSPEDVRHEMFCDIRNPKLIEIIIDEYTYITPKLEYGKPNQDQEPLIERKLYKRLMRLE